MQKWTNKDTVILSDLHIGSSTSKVEKVYEFLKEVIQNLPQRVIIVGDAFELWSTNFKKMGKEEYKVIRKFLEIAENGIEVIYIPGNHDRAFKGFQNLNIGKIKILNEYELKSKAGNFLVLHGDEFDFFTRNHIILSLILDKFFIFLVKTGRKIKRFVGFNISVAAKKNSGRYLKTVKKIRLASIAYAKSRKMDGVIIGHTHWPEKVIKDHIVYVNTGDWINNFSYSVIGDGVKLEYYK